ncbi:unnamed protein product [Vicia faba]|uniref:Uncharacterized protein n=1 Tax=Vicia faba TaxID=3906 RepID=A0AAV1BA62_VICFA|nr:unnamed protein product [Vicia faba]
MHLRKHKFWTRKIVPLKCIGLVEQENVSHAKTLTQSNKYKANVSVQNPTTWNFLDPTNLSQPLDSSLSQSGPSDSFGFSSHIYFPNQAGPSLCTSPFPHAEKPWAISGFPHVPLRDTLPKNNLQRLFSSSPDQDTRPLQDTIVIRPGFPINYSNLEDKILIRQNSNDRLI